jgi:NAD(P)H-hydrate epimerase
MRNDGADVLLVLTGEPEKISGDAKINYDICVKMGIAIEIISSGEDCSRIESAVISECGIIIDAMLGTGVKGELRNPMAAAVSMINKSGKYVVSVDSPTGGNPDNGKTVSECVRADLTVTLGLAKPGLLLYPLAEYTGRLVVAGIGADMVFNDFKADMFALDELSAREMLPKRHNRSHKGTYGKVVIAAGSQGMTGAAAFCAKAAYKAGCGYVDICAPQGITGALALLAPQAVTTALPEKDGCVCGASVEAALEKINRATVCLIGPGLGNNESTAVFVNGIIKGAKVPLIIDADGLNVLDSRILLTAAYPPVITPHPLEMSRLSGLPVLEITDNIMKTCMDFAGKYNTITLLKDAATVISDRDGRKVYINKGSCSALAKAGSGDVLAGITAAFMAQGLNGFNACALAAYIHSRSGIAAALKYGDYSVCCDDIIEHIVIC